jgi:hypothetical protein
MDKRIIKTMLVIFGAGLMTLITPIIGMWYEKQTGIMPVGFYAVLGIGGLVVVLMSILKIWGEIK